MPLSLSIATERTTDSWQLQINVTYEQTRRAIKERTDQGGRVVEDLHEGYIYRGSQNDFIGPYMLFFIMWSLWPDGKQGRRGGIK